MNKYVILMPVDGDVEERAMGWLVLDGTQVYIDGNPPQLIPGIVISSKKTVENSTDEILKAMNFYPEIKQIRIARVILDIGQYYPRIYRPFMRNVGRFKFLDELSMIEVHDQEFDSKDPASYPPVPIDNSAYLKSLSQLALLCERLAFVFRTIEPESTNLEAYGHEIRNLFIIACTEVETQWKAILNANHYTGDRWTTNDFVKLLAPLRLADYEINLPLYPGIPALSPFHKWNANQPTQSLTWYDAYNATKHDREKNFSQATMSNVINAIAACAILLIAQFGKRNSWKSELGEFFRITKVPVWKQEEMYARTPSQSYTSVNCKF
jgi:hypothetical protein